MPGGAAPTAPPLAAAVHALLSIGQTPLGLADILRALSLPTSRKAELRTLLHSMALSGALLDLPAQRLKTSLGLPDIRRVRVTTVYADGTARGVLADMDALPPVALVSPPTDTPILLPDDLLLARLRPSGAGHRREAKPLRLLARVGSPIAVTGAESAQEQITALVVCHPRMQATLPMCPDQAPGTLPNPGTIALAALHQTGSNSACAAIDSTLGRADAPGMSAQLSLLTHHAPVDFPADAMAQSLDGQRMAQTMQDQPPDSGRDDLRALPFITIDEADAHDFDDALWAEQDEQGLRLIVAIADVSHFVPAGSALDVQAHLRGTSLYLPGQVVPMLPPALSDDACSLRPGLDRACLYMDMRFTPQGTLASGRIGRGLIRSAARLTYEDTQATLEGQPLPACHPIHALPPALLPTLHHISTLLDKAAHARGACTRDEEAWRIGLDATGQPVSFTPRVRLPAHTLVAACMIAANTLAATMLARLGAGGLYRIHPAPTPALPRPMARYSATPAFHDGLKLPLYTHFTSPIRRYADLVNHRVLAACCESGGMACGPDTLPPISTVSQPPHSMATLVPHLTFTERRATEIAQDCHNRMAAVFLASQVGQRVSIHVMTTSRHGFWVRLTKTGTPSFLPWTSFANSTDAYDDSLHDGVAPRHSTRTQSGTVLSAILIATCPARGTVVLASPVHAC